MPIETIMDQSRVVSKETVADSGFYWREEGGVKVLVCRALEDAGFANGFSSRLGGVSSLEDSKAGTELNLAGFDDGTRLVNAVIKRGRPDVLKHSMVQRFLANRDIVDPLAEYIKQHGKDAMPVLDACSKLFGDNSWYFTNVIITSLRNGCDDASLSFIIHERSLYGHTVDVMLKAVAGYDRSWDLVLWFSRHSHCLPPGGFIDSSTALNCLIYEHFKRGSFRENLARLDDLHLLDRQNPFELAHLDGDWKQWGLSFVDVKWAIEEGYCKAGPTLINYAAYTLGDMPMVHYLAFEQGLGWGNVSLLDFLSEKAAPTREEVAWLLEHGCPLT